MTPAEIWDKVYGSEPEGIADEAASKVGHEAHNYPPYKDALVICMAAKVPMSSVLALGIKLGYEYALWEREGASGQ